MQKNLNCPKIWLQVKSPLFLSNQANVKAIFPTQELVILFVCLFVTGVPHFCVSTGPEQGGYVNLLRKQLVIQLWIPVACPNPYTSFLSGTLAGWGPTAFAGSAGFMVSNPVWLKSIRRAADSNPRTSIRKASVMTTRPEGILLVSDFFRLNFLPIRKGINTPLGTSVPKRQKINSHMSNV